MLPPSRKDSGRLRTTISALRVGLPELSGSPIFISVGSQLTAHGGKLLSGSPQRGTQVHAASFIRDRHIVLDSYLLRRTHLLRLILVHELFHFIWSRLGNRSRAEYTLLLLAEREGGAKGELGESAAVGKLSFQTESESAKRERRWRDYVCESFCDTAAWLYAGVNRHREFTLAARWRERRSNWFHDVFSAKRHC